MLQWKKTLNLEILKACVGYFLVFHQMIPSSSHFFTVSHCFRGWLNINLKIYDVINFLSKNLMTFCLISWRRIKVWHWNSVDSILILKINYRWKNLAESVQQKLVPDPFLILVNNPEQPSHAINSFKNKYILKRGLTKSLEKLFFFQPSSF